MHAFERGTLRFAVTDSGPPDAQVVILLHGFPQQPRGFTGVAERLNAAGLRTLIPSQRGYTATARPPRRRDYRTEETAADVIALLDAAGLDRAHIVGHDMGGAQAWASAAWYPNRVSSLTVLSTPHPAAMRKAFLTSTQGLVSWYIGFFQLPLVPELLAPLTLGRAVRGTELPPKYIAIYLDAMADFGAFRGALNWYRGIPFSRQLRNRADHGAHHLRVGQPRCRADAPSRRAHRRLRRRQLRIPELSAGHWLPEAHPAETRRQSWDRDGNLAVDRHSIRCRSRASARAAS